jgi:hypothetical protein
LSGKSEVGGNANLRVGIPRDEAALIQEAAKSVHPGGVEAEEKSAGYFTWTCG